MGPINFRSHNLKIKMITHIYTSSVYIYTTHGGADSDPTARFHVVLLWWRTHKTNPKKLARVLLYLLLLLALKPLRVTDPHGISHAHLRKGNEVRRAAAAPSLDGRVAGAPVRCWNSSCCGGGTCGPALVDCGCGIGYEAGFGAGFGAGCGSRSRSAVVARQLQRRGRAGSGTSAAREGAATGATLAAVRRARRSLGRGPTRAEAPADDEKARGRGPRGRVGCCRARDRGLRARTAGAAWGGALRTSHSHRGTIRAHSGHYRIAARRGQHTVRGRRTSYIQQQTQYFVSGPTFCSLMSGRLGPSAHLCRTLS